MHLPSHIRHELWKQGKPLSKAFDVFKQAEIAKKPVKEETDSQNEEKNFWKKVGDNISKGMNELAQDNSIQNQFIRLAIKGTNIWLGLSSPEGVHDAPVIIPITHIENIENALLMNPIHDDIKITKKHDEKEYIIARYVQIRMISRKIFVKAQQEYVNSQGKAPIVLQFKQVNGKVGRPSVKAYLVEAFDALTMEDKINFNGSFRSHCPLIRAWLVQSYPQDSARLGNLADETMRKVLSPLFYEHQKTNHH